MVLKVLHYQRFGTVLLLEQLRVGVRNFDWCVFKDALTEWENVFLKVMMSIFAHHDSLSALSFGGCVWSQGCDVDEKTRLRIDPAGVDYV